MNDVRVLSLGLEPTIHARLAVEVPTVIHYLTKSTHRNRGGNDGREQALAALDEHLVQHVAPPVRSGIEMMTAVGQLRPTGSPRLDGLLSAGVHLTGGYRDGQMIEFVGESGSGKTQVCLLAAAANAARGTAVLYIDTGNAFSTQRLKSLFEALPDVQKCGASLEEILGRIQVQKAFEAQALLKVLHTLSTELAAASPECAISTPGLLIIDAFSAVMAPTLGRAQQTQGHAVMLVAARTLKALAVRHSMAVIVVNHIVGGAQDPRPALGEHWRSQPHARVHLVRRPGSVRAAVLKSSTLLRPGASVLLELEHMSAAAAVPGAGPAAA